LVRTYQKSGFNAFFVAGKVETGLLVLVVYVWNGLGHLTFNHDDTKKDYLPLKIKLGSTHAQTERWKNKNKHLVST